MNDDSPTTLSRRVPPGACQWDREESAETVAIDADRGTYRTSFEYRTEAPSTAVVSTVAAVTGTDPLALEPLYSAVDPDALDALVEHTVTGAATGDVHVTFTLHDHEVTVHSYGSITAEPIHDEGRR